MPYDTGTYGSSDGWGGIGGRVGGWLGDEGLGRQIGSVFGDIIGVVRGRSGDSVPPSDSPRGAPPDDGGFEDPSGGSGGSSGSQPPAGSVPAGSQVPWNLVIIAVAAYLIGQSQ